MPDTDDNRLTNNQGHASDVKLLLRTQQRGTLSTHSSHQSGYPFGSMMPYALDKDDQPILLISKLAMHTQNIMHNAKASLFVAEQSTTGAPFATGRVTIMGELLAVEDEAVRTYYLKAHPDAQQWVDFADFSFYRMDISAIYFVAGFGKMSWVSQQAYAQATTGS